MTALPSHLAGRWTDPDDHGVPIRHAATGHEVARISTSGIDMGAAVAHARAVDGTPRCVS